MKIRLAERKDAGAISVLLTYLAEKYIAVGFPDEGVRNVVGSVSPAAIQRYLHQGFRYHVGELDGEIIGVVGTRDNSHLFHLFVDDRFQGAGYASRLWAVAREACVEAGNPGYFTVNSSLNAREIYRRWGFVPVNGIREGGGVRDQPMKLDLTG